MKLPEFAVRRPVTTLGIYVALIAISIMAFTRMSIDLMPDVAFPTMGIFTSYQGASAEEVEEKITRLVESQVSIVRDLKEINSVSREGSSIVRLIFEWGTDLDAAANDVRDRLGFLRNLLPEESEDPVILRFDLNQIPIMFMGATAQESYPNLYHILDKDVSDMLKRVPGVGNVFVRGGYIRQINLNVDRHRLEAYGLTLTDVKNALRDNNLTVPAGNIKIARTDYLLRVPGEFTGVEQVNNMPVGKFRERQIYFKDIGNAEDFRTEETERISVNGEPGAILFVQKRGEANTVKVADGIKQALPEIRKRVPPDVKLNIMIDNSLDIRRTIGNLTETMWIAIGLIFGVILLFIRQIRPAFIVFTSVPISLLDSFMFQYFFGYTINTISLLALTIAVGLVVDDAIVVMENQIRHQEELGEDAKTAAVKATSEVGLAVTASTLTSVAVFIPVFFATGIAGVMFGQLAVVIGITLLLSLFDALLLNPMLCSIFLRKKERRSQSLADRFYHWTEGQLIWLQNSYRKVISSALSHRIGVLVLAGVIFLGGILLIPLVGTEFFPEEDSGQLQAEIQLPVGTRVEATHTVIEELQGYFQKTVKPEWVVGYFWRDGYNPKMGFGGLTGQKEASNVGRFQVVMVEKDKREVSIKEINQKLRTAMQDNPQIERIGFFSGSLVSRLLLGRDKPVVVDIYGYELDKTYPLAEKIKKMMEQTEGLTDAAISIDLSRPEFHVNIDRQKAAALGISVKEIADVVNLAFAQQRAATYRETGEEYDMVIRMEPEQRKSEADLEGLFVKSPFGEMVRLSNLVTLEPTLGPLEIERQDQQRVIRVEANTYGSSLGQITVNLEQKLKRIPLPPGVSLGFSGSIKEQKESFGDLRLALLLGIFLTYLVMASQFESFVVPFVIMFSVPFGFVGAILMFVVFDRTLNVATFIGIIMMIGLVVKNAIVYLDYAIQLERKGWGTREALIEAGRVRLRPILMTASAMILGLLPMALSTKQGSEIWQPLAMSVIGGLAVSTAVTLILIPTVYHVVQSIRGKLKTAEVKIS
ncbi:MAG: hypothetical protein A2Z27_04055 [candidate division Zixibacteria bacterium RBG_16_50_21]|nr:MAG: hypothetical protein A2Z27_04055 [candidate division Zixibacteria bacterium RBG_16_50_21]